MPISLRVNGAAVQVEAAPGQPLLEVLRDELGLVSLRGACGIGVCGTCTALLDGLPTSTCNLLVGQAEGREILTVEGLALGDQLHPIQQAFIDHAAFQCAYCTPGFILTALACLRETPNADDEAIREYLEGNLCRCGSYVNILAAVRAARDLLAASNAPL